VSQKLFQAACAALWGPQYRAPAARVLGIHLRSLMRYDAGERTVPPALFVRLLELLLKRELEIGKLKPKVAAAGEKGARSDARVEADHG